MSNGRHHYGPLSLIPYIKEIDTGRDSYAPPASRSFGQQSGCRHKVSKQGGRHPWDCCC